MKRLFKRLLSYFPAPLPVGLTSFNEWADSIIELSGKFADEDSLKWAISNMVMHLPSTTDRVPKNYFVKCLRKTAANQVCGQVFMDIKEKQKAAQDMAAAKQAEDTAQTQAAPDEKSQG